MRELYTFCVDTDKYAGDFASHLCAYVTGRVGECGEGAELAARTDLVLWVSRWLDASIAPVICVDGIRRPCSIVLTPGWFHDGLGDYYEQRRGAERLAAERYNNKLYDYVIANCKNPQDAEEWKISHPPVKAVSKWPAYLSVGMHFQYVPTLKLTDIFKKRCREFCVGPSSRLKININGFRLLRHRAAL